MKEGKGRKGAFVKDKAPKVQDKDIKKRNGAAKEAKAKKAKAAKKVKDPNALKRPQTAFFIFLNDFRMIFKEEHPDVEGVAAIGKAGGERWQSMLEADKRPFVTKAAQKKAEYDRGIASYKQKQVQWPCGQHSGLRCLTVVDDGDFIEMLTVDLGLILYTVACKWITDTDSNPCNRFLGRSFQT